MKHFETEPTEQKVFWYVFVPGNGEPKEKHYSFQYAKAEAQRIARKTGKETFILQALKSYVVNDIEERNYMHEPKTFPLSIADFKKAKKELSKKKIKNKNADFGTQIDGFICFMNEPNIKAKEDLKKYYENYMKNPVILANHDDNIKNIVGKVTQSGKVIFNTNKGN